MVLALLVSELLLVLLLVKGSLVELLLLELRSRSLKLDVALLFVVGSDVLSRVWRVLGVRGDLSDTGVQLEVFGILQGQFLVRLVKHERVSELSRGRLGGWDARWGLDLPVEWLLLLLERDLGETGPDCRGRVAHSFRGPASKTAGIMIRALRDLLDLLLLRLCPAVVAAG